MGIKAWNSTKKINQQKNCILKKQEHKETRDNHTTMQYDRTVLKVENVVPKRIYLLPLLHQKVRLVLQLILQKITTAMKMYLSLFKHLSFKTRWKNHWKKHHPKHRRKK